MGAKKVRHRFDPTVNYKEHQASVCRYCGVRRFYIVGEGHKYLVEGVWQRGCPRCERAKPEAEAPAPQPDDTALSISYDWTIIGPFGSFAKQFHFPECDFLFEVLKMKTFAATRTDLSALAIKSNKRRQVGTS